MKPYKEIKVNSKTVIREFDAHHSEEYEWHRDQEDRSVEVIKAGTNWFFQSDNCLPFLLFPGFLININKLVFHRLIKGDGKLIIKITKL
jgi:hypothetical protein